MARTFIVTPAVGRVIASRLQNSDNKEAQQVGEAIHHCVDSAIADPGPFFQTNLVVRGDS